MGCSPESARQQISSPVSACRLRRARAFDSASPADGSTVPYDCKIGTRGNGWMEGNGEPTDWYGIVVGLNLAVSRGELTLQSADLTFSHSRLPLPE